MSRTDVSRWKALIAAGVLASALATSPAATQEADATQIRRVVASAYIEGLHKNGSREAIRQGFHPDFVMKVLDGNEIVNVTIEEWIGRLPEEGTPVDHEVTHEVPTVSISGKAATAMVEVMFDGEHVFTDYMSLYEFEEGWRIVAKIFNREG